MLESFKGNDRKLVEFGTALAQKSLGLFLGYFTGSITFLGEIYYYREQMNNGSVTEACEGAVLDDRLSGRVQDIASRDRGHAKHLLVPLTQAAYNSVKAALGNKKFRLLPALDGNVARCEHDGLNYSTTFAAYSIRKAVNKRDIQYVMFNPPRDRDIQKEVDILLGQNGCALTEVVESLIRRFKHDPSTKPIERVDIKSRFKQEANRAYPLKEGILYLRGSEARIG